MVFQKGKMEGKLERENNELGVLFQQIVVDIKSSFPLWEDFTNKAVKLHSALRCTISTSTGFLDTFQKLADCALGTRGTKDIGSSLTRLCLRQRAIENLLKSFTVSIADVVVTPLQESMDEWKRSVVQMEKDHAKDSKKCHSEVKKASVEMNRLQKKVNKGKAECRSQLDEAVTELNSRISTLELTQKNYVSSALAEERNHFCLLINCLKPLVDQEIAMLSEVEQLKEIIDGLSKMAVKPSGVVGNESALIETSKHQSTFEQKHKKLLKDDTECDSVSNSSSSTRASLDALDLCGSALTPDASTNQNAPVILPAYSNKSNTISYGNQHARTRPVLSYDMYNPPITSRQGIIRSSSKSENPYAVPTTVPSNVVGSGSVKVVDKIYARPALVVNKEAGSTLKRVLPPTIPSVGPMEASSGKVQDFPFPASGYVTQSDMVGLAKLYGTSEEDHTLQKVNSANNSDELQSLADALRQLEASTAMLQMPYEATNAQSCQSLQCSSGYGTLTNVSASSVETIGSASDLEAMANALWSSADMSDYDKCSTLPRKYQMTNIPPQDFRRPASAAGLESVLISKRSQESIATVSSDKSISSGSSECVSMPSLGHYYTLPPPVGYGTSIHRYTNKIEEVDDMDDLPLPPPPEDYELDPMPRRTVQAAPMQRAMSVHANVMQSLEEKLSVRNTGQFQRSASLAQDAAPSHCALLRKPPGFKEAQSSDVNITPDDVTPEQGSLEHMIKRGIRLRHTICNDRSAPRVMRH